MLLQKLAKILFVIEIGLTQRQIGINFLSAD
jgi:hypothetical protein